MNRFWERVMLALVVCVPVPALALSGLNIPLPSVVERVAAALVPFASAATMDDGATLASGAIVHAPGHEAQTTPNRRPETATAQVARVVVRSVEKAPTTPLPRRADTVSGSLEPAKPGPTPTGEEEPTSDVPEIPAPAPAPDEPTPPVPPSSDEPSPGEPNVTPPVEPDVKPEPNAEADVAPTVDPPDAKPPDGTADPVPKPEPKPDDLPRPSTGDERRDANAVDAADSTSGE